MKNHSDLINKNRVVFICKDGREGLAEKGPFDVIHVGGAL